MTEETLEFNAGTVDAAIDRAASSLGISRDVLSYDVLDSGSTGFMGIGARDARISVRARSGYADVEEDVDSQPEEEPEVIESPLGLDSDDIPAPVQEEPEDTDQAAATPPEVIEEVREFMVRVVGAMNLDDARVDVYDAGDVIAVDVATEQTGLFIGQKGETIDALQHLLNVTVYKSHKLSKRLVIDTEGYRQRRVEAIQGIAHRMARRALRERRTVELPPMNPSERRIVHVYLKDDERITTASEGTGNNRRVKVIPA